MGGHILPCVLQSTGTINKNFHPKRNEYNRSVFRCIFIDRDLNYVQSFVSVIVHIVHWSRIEILTMLLYKCIELRINNDIKKKTRISFIYKNNVNLYHDTGIGSDSSEANHKNREIWLWKMSTVGRDGATSYQETKTQSVTRALSGSYSTYARHSILLLIYPRK